MAHRNEKFIRHNNPEYVTGVNTDKVGELVGSITHRNGQVGKTKPHFTITLKHLCSVKEIQTLAFNLNAHHKLGIRVVDVSSLWRDNLSC